ncbi:MAG: Glycosyltransferase [Parcubacteria group bacterium GW2011_GWA2_49_9]|nr:MAG: Glycosyltransferase [Parcubacteria group bacterium GW2011_GWA2_49_9]
MRVLNLSLDKTILEPDSAVQKRLLLLAEALGETTPGLGDLATPFTKGDLTVCVPGERTERKQLSPHLLVHSVGGPKPFQFFGLWLRARQELTRKKYDLITVQDAHFLGFLAAQLAEKYAVPLEVQIHGFEKMEGGRARLARFVFGKAKKIRVVSERLKKELDLKFKMYDVSKKIYILPVYTQIDLPQKMNKRNTVPVPFTFLTVGRLVPVKNIGLQISALAKIAEKIPHVRLRVVGDGPEMANLQQTTNNLQLQGKVFFEGYQKDLSKYYAEADAFLLTSDSEGWGRVVLEAAAHSLPIIMTNVGLAQEVITNNESGFIIPVGDERELTLAMQEFIGSPELRSRLGEGAYKVFKALPRQEEYIQEQVTEWQALVNRK